MIPFMDIYEIRRDNLRKLVKSRFGGKITGLADAVDKAHSYISRCLTDLDKNRKRIGEELAREIEGKLNLAPLTLDVADGQPGTREASNVTLASQPDRYFRYPVVSSVVAGGWGDAVQPYEPGAEDRSELSDYKAKGRAFWLEVDGDSMTSPSGQSIPEGMLILVDTGLEALPGHLVVAKLDNEEKATFKKLVNDAGQLYLKPLNPAYRMIPINGNCRIIGVVKEAKMKL